MYFTEIDEWVNWSASVKLHKLTSVLVKAFSQNVTFLYFPFSFPVNQVNPNINSVKYNKQLLWGQKQVKEG